MEEAFYFGVVHPCICLSICLWHFCRQETSQKLWQVSMLIKPQPNNLRLKYLHNLQGLGLGTRSNGLIYRTSWWICFKLSPVNHYDWTTSNVKVSRSRGQKSRSHWWSLTLFMGGGNTPGVPYWICFPLLLMTQFEQSMGSLGQVQGIKFKSYGICWCNISWMFGRFSLNFVYQWFTLIRLSSSLGKGQGQIWDECKCFHNISCTF